MKVEKTVDRGSKQKLYVQMYSIFLEKIKNAEWPTGSQIPSEDELCRMYDVSKVTVREAIQELVKEGYLKRLQGKGTFVLDSSSHFGIVMRTRLSEEDMYGKGERSEKKILQRGLRTPTDEARNFLMTEDQVYYVMSRNVVGEEEYSEEFFIPLHIIPDIDREDISSKSLYEFIDEHGAKKISRVVLTVKAIMLPNNGPEVQRMKGGSHALLIQKTFIGSDGVPIALSRVVGNGKGFGLEIEFEKIT